MNGSLPFNTYTISTFRKGTTTFQLLLYGSAMKRFLLRLYSPPVPSAPVPSAPVPSASGQFLQTGNLGGFKDAFLYVGKPATQTPEETIFSRADVKAVRLPFSDCVPKTSLSSNTSASLGPGLQNINLCQTRKRACHATLALLHKQIIKQKYYCSTELGIVSPHLALVQACKLVI